jgi:hypothetical protein
MALNWPHPKTGQTQIAQAWSDDGILWSGLRVILAPPASIIGYETPGMLSLGEAGMLLGVLTKQKLPDGRSDRVDFFLETDFFRGSTIGGLGFTGLSLEPSLPWEARWRNPQTAMMDGGIQEPSMVRVGDTLVCVYTAHCYAAGYLPSTGLAYLRPGGTQWNKLPEPIVRNSGQPDLCEVRSPSGERGWLLCTQARPGTSDTSLEARYSIDLLHWSEPRDLGIARRTPTARRVVGPCYVPGHGLYYWGEDISGGPNAIMFAPEAS